MKSLITNLFRYNLASLSRTSLFTTSSNTYVGVGRPIRWGSDENEEDSEIEEVSSTTDYLNQVWRDMFAIKKIEVEDVCLVIPRTDWAYGTKYDEYHNGVEFYSTEKKMNLGTVNATANIVTNSTAIFTGNISTSNILMIGTESREIISIPNTTSLILNSALTGTYVNVSAYDTIDTTPHFSKNFYVRNSKDQIFKCLENNDDESIIEPTIDIDGQLPENPYITTGDGYKWKYMYTIPYGLKQKFFNKTWMPILTDSSVKTGAENGRIDIINILDGGSGYFLDNGESGNTNSASIITVTGDGNSASITAKIESGVITGLNILNGGLDYTTAILEVEDPNQLITGTPASFDVVIGTPGGHGSDPSRELGCHTIMTVIELEGTEGDKIPIGSENFPFDFRQISLIRDPLLANGEYSSSSVHSTITKIAITEPGAGASFLNDETVFIGESFVNSTMTAIVVNWDNINNVIHVNNIAGNIVVGSTIRGVSSGAGATILNKEDSTIKLFTGDIMYVENRQKVIRDATQTEQIRLVFSL